MKIIRKKNLRSAVLYNVKNTLHNCTFAYELHDASPSLIFSATNIRRLTVKVKSIPGTATTLAILARVASSRLTKFLPCLPALFLSGLFTEPRHTATAATHKPERRNGTEPFRHHHSMCNKLQKYLPVRLRNVPWPGWQWLYVVTPVCMMEASAAQKHTNGSFVRFIEFVCLLE